MHISIPSASVASEMGQETGQASQPACCAYFNNNKRSYYKPRGRRAPNHEAVTPVPQMQLCNGARVSLSQHTETHIYIDTAKAKRFFLCLKMLH